MWYYFTLFLELLANQWYLKVILEKFFEAIVGLIVGLFPSLIANLPTEAAVREKLEPLRDRATRIRARLDDADQNRHIEKGSVLLWLSELRAIAFDIEDLNEEFEARALVAGRASLWAGQYNRDVLGRIDRINKDYEAIFNDRTRLLEFADTPAANRITTTRHGSGQTGSLEGSGQLYGRHEELCQLHRLLLQNFNSTRHPPVISITGQGGIGKTALARSAFNRDEIMEQFDLLKWVSLSLNPDPVETIKKIIEAITETNCNLSTLDMVQRKLQQLVSGQKILLVLDGVYTEATEMLFWDPVWIPLRTAKLGSRVLATTRNQTTTKFLGSLGQVPLSGLNSSVLWLVMKDEAFAQTTSSLVPTNLETIGQQIAAKCGGSPLAAKLLGRALHDTTNEEDWNNLLEGMPNPGEVVDNILPSLKVSYELLPLNLKRCFAYCSIFPKEYKFDRDELVKLWMSEGLIKTEQSNRTPEDIGRKQFTDLLWRSFFQPCEQPCDHDSYVMPNAIHDLAQSLSMYECARVGYSGSNHGELKKPRYALLCGDHAIDKSLNIITGKKHLRTLIIDTSGPVAKNYVSQKKLSSNLKCLRSLDLSKCRLDNLHESICNLIHLRYLNLCGSSFERLTEKICNLINLQTLNLNECYELKELPKCMSSMINMRHIGLRLNWDNQDEILWYSMPPDLGRLTSLQTLSRFSVAEGDGCKVTELKNLNLRGELCIYNLENVQNGDEAREAQLKVKRHLRFLMLRWTSRKSFNSAKEEQVIRQLYPSDAIKSIWIEGYNGSEFPPWITYPTFKDLETLKLFNCKVCVNLPQVAKLPQIKNLHLTGLSKVKDLNQLVCQNGSSVEFRSLELLHLSDMPELENFIESNVSLPHLRELSISNCPQLKQITNLPASLNRFEIRNCTSLNQLPPVPSLSILIVEGVDLSRWVYNLASLTSLTLINVPDLRFITSTDLSGLSSLKMLKIDGCNKLEAIARDGTLQYLPSVKKLEISRCPNLQMFCEHGLPCQIEELHLKDLKSVSSLPSGMDLSSHFHTLDIEKVPMLPSLPAMPSSLHNLYIHGCPKLEKSCDIGGPDWPKISHVRCLLINGTQLQ